MNQNVLFFLNFFVYLSFCIRHNVSVFGKWAFILRQKTIDGIKYNAKQYRAWSLKREEISLMDFPWHFGFTLIQEWFKRKLYHWNKFNVDFSIDLSNEKKNHFFLYFFSSNGNIFRIWKLFIMKFCCYRKILEHSLLNSTKIHLLNLKTLWFDKNHLESG